LISREEQSSIKKPSIPPMKSLGLANLNKPGGIPIDLSKAKSYQQESLEKNE